MEQELKACPFCGCVPTVEKDEVIDSWFLECRDTCLMTPFSTGIPGDTKENLFECWNRRAPDTWIPYDPQNPPKGLVAASCVDENGVQYSETTNMLGVRVFKDGNDIYSSVTHYLPLPPLPSLPESK